MGAGSSLSLSYRLLSSSINENFGWSAEFVRNRSSGAHGHSGERSK